MCCGELSSDTIRLEGGQGVGLTVVRQLVHGMGGRVRHVRPLEGGAAFVLSF